MYHIHNGVIVYGGNRGQRLSYVCNIVLGDFIDAINEIKDALPEFSKLIDVSTDYDIDRNTYTPVITVNNVSLTIDDDCVEFSSYIPNYSYSVSYEAYNREDADMIIKIMLGCSIIFYDNNLIDYCKLFDTIYIDNYKQLTLF